MICTGLPDYCTPVSVSLSSFWGERRCWSHTHFRAWRDGYANFKPKCPAGYWWINDFTGKTGCHSKRIFTILTALEGETLCNLPASYTSWLEPQKLYSGGMSGTLFQPRWMPLLILSSSQACHGAAVKGARGMERNTRGMGYHAKRRLCWYGCSQAAFLKKTREIRWNKESIVIRWPSGQKGWTLGRVFTTVWTGKFAGKIATRFRQKWSPENFSKLCGRNFHWLNGN